MKVLVTGSTGFVGSHLCERLMSEGHHVYALARSPSKLKDLLGHYSPEKLTIIQGDLNHFQCDWVDLLPDDLDACIHTAGLVHAYRTKEFFQVNTHGTSFLANSLKKRFQSLHFILISSLAAAGPNFDHNRKNESDLDFPISLYGRSKKEAEEALRKAAPDSWDIAIVRPPMVIGPRDPAVLDIFKMVQGKIILLAGKNAKKRAYSFVCVFDLVETITKVLTHKKSSLYYSAFPETFTYLDLVTEIKGQLKSRWMFFLPLPLFFVRFIAHLLSFISRFWNHSQRLTPDKYHEIAAMTWTCDARKSEDELAQVYHYDLKRTISLTLLDYKSRKWI